MEALVARRALLTFAAVATGAIACNSTLDLARPVDPPSDWWDCGFGHRRAITATLSTGGTLADFPVAVRLDPARIDYTATQVSGGDLRFVIGTGAAAVVLDHEIETWSPGAESVIWVRVPLLAAAPGSTVFRLYYGNPGAADVQDPPGVWDASFQGVWHLTTTTAMVPDSTSHQNHGVLAGATATNGRMGPALAFDGDDAVRITAPSFHDSFGSFTVSLWARADSLPEQAPLYYNLNGHNLYPRFRLLTNGFPYLQLSTVEAGTEGFQTAGSPLPTGQGHHLATTFDDATGTSTIQVNAASGASYTFAGTTLQGGTLNLFRLGEDPDTGFHLRGMLDEVRVSSAVRSTDWLAAEHRTLTDSMLSFGAQEDQDCPE